VKEFHSPRHLLKKASLCLNLPQKVGRKTYIPCGIKYLSFTCLRNRFRGTGTYLKTVPSFQIGCIEVNGMESSQFIAKKNIETRGMTEVPEKGRNTFLTTAKQFAKEKPRIDIQLSGDGSPVPVTKVAIYSADEDGVFRIKYKETKNDDPWKDLILPGDDKISVSHSSHYRHLVDYTNVFCVRVDFHWQGCV
jgi:hypothetical protein